ncbi:hypothetical protein D1B31_15145 [Neobacillus notoginsengisoli]|uniref:YtkA-like domain-containing protein n=1 Tax=Neobacillus notoginsengisoli TaxID=1578198 RepID=A0A417YS42_9BACI|nr:FixH family protein [Neobacillus notoginsengisoli]RHW38110.1 hypothetical protein D1B31_15145 [Neobacillus notoginsengisoli]
MKKLMVLFIGLLAVALVGCADGEDQDNSAGTNEPPKLIEVEILLPDKIDPNVETEIKTHVTQDGENVEDANEVKFEVFKAGDKDHEMLEAKHIGDGVYGVKKTFTEEGNYVVISHVTAREMHNMPKKEFVVGNPSEAESEHGSSGGHEHGHGESSVAIDFPVNSADSGEDTLLTAVIKHEDKPLEGAKITFEIWKHGDEKHDFTPAKEVGGGKYEWKHAFPSAGEFTVNVHVEIGNLHEHEEKTVTVN